MKNRVLLIIPARLASTRLPRKMLLHVDEERKMSLLQATVERVKRSQFSTPSNIFVATCDEEIREAAESFGANVVMTSHFCESGSDRVAEAASKLVENNHIDVVVNIQGDEPFLDPIQLDLTITGLLSNEWADVSTCAAKMVGPPVDDPSKVKVIVSSSSSALYFSRARIPHQAESWLRHIGLYAYRPNVLQAFTKMASSKLEKTERLEQLRLLEADYKIFVAQVQQPFDDDEYGFGGVDTREDLERARALMKRFVQNT